MSNINHINIDNIPKKWLEDNIYVRADTFIKGYFLSNLIIINNIENLIINLNIKNYTSEKAYSFAVLDYLATIINEWYLISPELYNKLRLLGYYVIQIDDIYIWGKSIQNKVYDTNINL